MKDQDAQMFAYASWMAKHGGFVKDMTVRDHFAGLAMQGICVSKDEAGTLVNHGYEWIAGEAYRIADAMLKARGDK